MLFLPKKNDKLLKGIEFLILKKIIKIAIVKKVVVLKNIAIVINKAWNVEDLVSVKDVKIRKKKIKFINFW